MKNLVTIAAVVLAVVSGAVAINANARANQIEESYKDALIEKSYLKDGAELRAEHLAEENEELWGSVYNLIDIICDNESESWRPMCEDRSWELVSDQLWEEEGLLMSQIDLYD